MQKVLIWDNTGNTPAWCKKFLDMKDVEIIHTITPAEPAPEILLRPDAWDWLLIFERKMRATFDTIINTLKLPTEKIVYVLDTRHWLQRPKAITAILNDSGGGVMRRWLNFNNCRQLNDIVACTVEGLSYVATAKDNIIMRVMYVDRINYAAGTMKRFHELTQKYYGVDDNSGYFLDLGANIGTTGIYFIKKLAPNLKLLAFEPDAENFRMLSVNLLLNDMEDKATIVKCGLGNKFDEMTMYRDLGNPGGNRLVLYKDDMPRETIKIMPLDAYFAENNIAARDVKYIWIDTEGFEAQVLLGAKNLLAENPAPIFVEFNLGVWRKSGCFDEFFAVIAESYSHFILINGGKETLYPIDVLRSLTPPPEGLGRIGGDIFLIKASVIT
ncbi:MAG: FkbM family methyltransferase [Selenomonadaceae bacterium]|nr:FkbM family methyltransferase [Selenomonadaceae bacterium]